MKKLLLLSLLLASWSLSVCGQQDSVGFSPPNVHPEVYKFSYQDPLIFSPQPNFSLDLATPPTPALQLDWNNLSGQFRSYRFSGFEGIVNDPFQYQNPFLSAYSVNTTAIYRFNDKWTMGGSSFSGNSVFNPNKFNLDPARMPIQGMNFYMEYKVTGKFSIGGGVQINNRGY